MRNFSNDTFELVDLISLIYHTCSNIIGILLNLVLILAATTQTPTNFRNYSLLIANFAITDLVACLCDIFTQQRLVPIGNGMVMVAHSICNYFSPTVCYSAYALLLHTYSHTMCSIAVSFAYKYYVLVRPQPTTRTFFAILLATYSISFIEWIILLSTNDDHSVVRKILFDYWGDEYQMSGRNVYGFVTVYTPKALLCLAHTAITPLLIYSLILVFRRKIVNRVTRPEMTSKSTRRLHGHLVKALTYQASLPILFALGVGTYLIAQLGIYSHPLMEFLSYSITGLVPILSPLISLYYVKSYSRFIARVFCRKVYTGPASSVSGGTVKTLANQPQTNTTGPSV